MSVLWHLAIPVTQKRGREDTSAGTVLLRPSQEGSFPASYSHYIESVFGTYIIPSLESKVTDDVTIWRIFVTHLISVSCDCFLSLRFYLPHRGKSNDSKAKVSPRLSSHQSINYSRTVRVMTAWDGSSRGTTSSTLKTLLWFMPITLCSSKELTMGLCRCCNRIDYDTESDKSVPTMPVKARLPA